MRDLATNNCHPHLPGVGRSSTQMYFLFSILPLAWPMLLEGNYLSDGTNLLLQTSATDFHNTSASSRVTRDPRPSNKMLMVPRLQHDTSYITSQQIDCYYFLFIYALIQHYLLVEIETHRNRLQRKSTMYLQRYMNCVFTSFDLLIIFWK